MKFRNTKINRIKEGYHPRKDFTGKEELKESIEKEGLLDPISVRRDSDHFIVIDGVIRLRVVQELGWETVPCIIQDVDEKTAAHLSYIRNSEEARKNLNPIEVSLHIKEMRERFGYSVKDLVDLGYAEDDQTIYNKLSLLTLPEKIQEKIALRQVSPTSGYHLAKLKNADLQTKIAEDSIVNSDSCRKVEKKVRSLIDLENRKREKQDQQIKIPKGDIPGVFFKDSSDMSELGDESVGLIVTSPPYGVGMEYEEDISFENHLKMMSSVLSECVRVLFPGGKICINVGDIHNFGTRNGGKPEIELIGHHLQGILGNYNVRLVDKIIWKKCTSGKRDFNWSANPHVNYHNGTKHTSYRILNNTEYIYIFEKEGKRKVPFDIEYESKISKDEWKEWVDGVWEIPPVKGEKGHPAPFPAELVKRLIFMYSYKGDLVLDCFGGSMTTVMVANELGRIGVGYEKEERYKSVIMEKLGIEEEDLRKADPKTAHKEKDKKESDPMGQFQESIIEIVKENNKTTKDIISVEVPYKSSISKDDIVIEWAPDSEEPDPPEAGDPPKVTKADDYEAQGSPDDVLSIILGKSNSPVPERCSNISSYFNKVILGDCVEKLKDIPDNSVQLLVTDPPYGLKFMDKDWDKALPPVEAWKECFRVLEDGAFGLIMCTPKQHRLSRMMTNLQDAGFKIDFTSLYWTYAVGKASGTRLADNRYRNYEPKPAVEVIIVVMKGDKGVTYLDDCRIAYTHDREKWSHDGGIIWSPERKWNQNCRRRSHPKGRFPANLLVSDQILGTHHSHFFSLDTWTEKNLPFLIVPKAQNKEKGEGNNHPTVKPIKLMSYLITLGSREGDVVLDPFAGSGTTCVAAKMLNRKFIGIELKEEYYEIAIKRVENAAMKKAA